VSPHVCWKCIASAAPSALERIAAGAICQDPECTNLPSGRCRCCSSAFCSEHLDVSGANCRRR
jgi:hypothetical protein